MMKLQRLIAAGLATSLSMGMMAGAVGGSSTPTEPTTPTTPSDSSGANQSMNVTSTVQVPTISVVMPTDTSVVLNPYGMSVKVGAVDSTDSILSPVWNIQSKTDSALQMYVDAVGTPAGKAKLVESKAEVNGEDRNIYMVMAYKFGSEAIAGIDEMAVDTIASSSGNVAPSGNTPGQYVITTTKGYVNGMDPADVPAAELGVNTFASAMVDGAASTDGTFLSMRMVGKANSAPSMANAWTESDTVNVALAFTFQPVKTPVVASYTGAQISMAPSGTATIAPTDIRLANAANGETVTAVAVDTKAVDDSTICGAVNGTAADVGVGKVKVTHTAAGSTYVNLKVTTSEGNTVKVKVPVTCALAGTISAVTINSSAATTKDLTSSDVSFTGSETFAKFVSATSGDEGKCTAAVSSDGSKVTLTHVADGGPTTVTITGTTTSGLTFVATVAVTTAS